MSAGAIRGAEAERDGLLMGCTRLPSQANFHAWNSVAVRRTVADLLTSTQTLNERLEP
jgi:hypothetical protein